MQKFTKSLESSTRKKIDQILFNLGYNIDEENPKCNVFTERAKTTEENKKFKGKFPDYVVYSSRTNEPIAIIEAKRKGENIDRALNQAIELYAKPLKVNIVFAYDGSFFKSYHIKDKKELVIDNEPVTQLVSERKLELFVNTHSITEITKQVKHTRNELINSFKWANNLLRKEGLREGIERFTEFSNLLFLKLIDEIEEEREKKGEKRILEERYCWRSFNKLSSEQMLDYINKVILPRLVDKYNHSGDVFQKELLIKNPNTLKSIVDKLNGLTLMNADTDVKGDAFEYFLKNSITLGNDLGEYFTPRHIVKLMVELIEPKFGEKIYDPTCGTGGFLIHAFNYIKQRTAKTEDNLKILKEKTVFGRELTSTSKVAKMNMIITGDGHNNIRQMDSLSEPVKGIYDVVLANPPYGQSTDFGEYYPLPSVSADSVFLQHIMLSLKEDGRAIVVIPEGVLFRSGEKKLRQYLLENYNLISVISLPPGVFRPYAKGNKTSIVYFEKGNAPTKQVWFYDLKEDGFDLESDLRPPVDKNDIPDLLSKWSEKLTSGKSWIVDIDEIKNNSYDLMAKTYSPIKKSSQTGSTKFSDFLTPSKEKIIIEDNKTYKQVKVKLNGKGAVLRKENLGKNIKTKAQFIVRGGQLIVSKIDARNGALAIIPKELDGSIVTSDFPVFNVDYQKINRVFLETYLRYNEIGKKLQRFSKGTTNRRRIKPENILKLEIKIPSKPEQDKIVEKIEKQDEIIKKAQKELSILSEKLKEI